ncbi:MAG: hypothetical protein SGBAC_012878 [Bacillariaceae sp.]
MKLYSSFSVITSFTSFVYCLLLLQASTNAFPSQLRLSNATKSRLMTPLTVDHKLLMAGPNGVNGDISDPASPRGIVLNTCVGGLTFCGGLMGYVTKGSKASLIAGSTFGGLLSLSAFLISKKQKAGNAMGTIVGSMLSYVMGKKFLASKKFMPAGLIASLGLATVVYNAIETFGGGEAVVKAESVIPQREAPKDDPVEKPTSTEEE